MPRITCSTQPYQPLQCRSSAKSNWYGPCHSGPWGWRCLCANEQCGTPLSHTGGPDLGGAMVGGGMMGGYGQWLTCASCHGPQGRGGKHLIGEEVKADMPRWTMSEADLADLFAFLKTLPE